MRMLFHVSRAEPVNALEAGGGFLDVTPRPEETLPGWNLTDLYPDGGAQLNADLERSARGAAEFRETYATKLEGLARENPAGAGKGHRRLRDSVRPDGPHRLLRLSELCNQHGGSGPREAVRRRPGQAHRRQHPASFLRAGVEPDRRRRHGRGPQRTGAWRITSPG